jgi:RNA polymerase subunit RPABC4/transcription elongation factor Spt4
MNSDQTETTNRREIVRCISCHGTMAEGLFRCPHCGQITTGNEKKVSELFLSMQMKARAAERKGRGIQCKQCGKQMNAEGICEVCSAKHRKNLLLLIIGGVLILLYFLVRLIV